MNRKEKETVISDLKDMFLKSEAAFLVNYKGLTVSQVQDLRAQLREQDALFKVAKARLMKRAVTDIENIGEFSDNFKDQIGLVFTSKDTPVAAKKVVEFSKDNEALDIVAGFFESKFISKEQVSFLASIPSRDVLLTKLVGSLQSPVTGLVCGLNGIVLKLLYVLQAIAKKKESE